VGANNLRYFLLFLLMTAMLCFYGTVLTAQIVVGIVREKRLLSVSYFDPVLQARRKLGWYRISMYLLATEYGLVALGLFLAIVGVMMAAFSAYHVYLIAKGTTTNESFRWDDVRDHLRSGRPILLPASAPAARGLPLAPAAPPPDPTTAPAPVTGTAPAAQRRAKGGDAATTSTTAAAAAAPAEREAVLTRTSQLVNIYNRGFGRNMAEALSPPAYLR
jgi:hypothetical protein